MIKAFVRRPVTTLMLVLFFVLMGAVAVFTINIEEYPKIDLPIVSVEIVYPGATPLEIESEILEIVEDAVSEVSQIKKITAQAFDSMALIMIEFDISADVNIQLLEVKDKVDAVLDEFPKDIETPLISKVDVLAAPVLILSLSSDNHSLKDLYEFADNDLKPVFNSVGGVSSVDVNGGDIREIRITLDAELMKQNFITIADIIDGVSNSNVNVSGGEIKQLGRATNVKFNTEFSSMDDIRNLVFTTAEGRNFKLGEIANVEDSIADRDDGATYNAEDSVILFLKNSSDGNAIEISKEVNIKLPSIRKLRLEPGMNLEIVKDTSTYIYDETVSTIEGIVIGMILTIIVILIFTANISSTLVTTIIIPTSLIATMFLVSQAGFTINSMTLLAIASVLGTLIANAIIILESATAKLAEGLSPEDAAIEGTKAVILPVFAGSGTNLAVFIPIAFMGGIAGKFFVQFGMTVVYATIISIIISFSLAPMLIAKLFKAHKKRNIFERASDALNNFIISNYHTVFKFLWRFKIIGLAISLAIMISSIMLIKYLGFEFQPSSDQDELNIKLVTPQGSTIETTTGKLKLIDDIILSHPEVESSIGQIGENGPTNAQLFVNLVPAKDRELSDLDLAVLITEEVSGIPDIEVSALRGDGNVDLTLNIYGLDYDKLVNYSKEIEKVLVDADVFRSIQSSYSIPKTESRFIPNQEVLNAYGINNAQIARVIRASIYGDDNNQYKENGNRYDINILLNPHSRNSAKVYENIFVSSPKGLIPISTLGEIKDVQSTSDLLRVDRQRVVEIELTLGKSSLGKVQTLLVEKLETIKFDDGYGYYFAGNAENAAETNAEMGKAFILAIILTYMVLAAVLNSFIHPVTIAISIVTSFAGVFVFLFFTDSSINIGSMLAMIMLVGLSVNNAILVVEYAIAKIKDDGATIEAAMWEALSNKMRTVMMTSIAIILSMVPQLFSSNMMKLSMGSVLIGGMAASVLFTLILTPLTFYYLERMIQITAKITSKFSNKTDG